MDTTILNFVAVGLVLILWFFLVGLLCLLVADRVVVRRRISFIKSVGLYWLTALTGFVASVTVGVLLYMLTTNFWVGLVVAFAVAFLAGFLMVNNAGKPKRAEAAKVFGLALTMTTMIQIGVGVLYTIDDQIPAETRKRLAVPKDTDPSRNGFYALLGFHRGKNEDAHAIGQEIVARYNRQIEQKVPAPVQFFEKDLDRYSVSSQITGFPKDGIDDLEIDNPDHVKRLKRLYDTNPLVIARYHALAEYNAFLNPTVPTALAPVPLFTYVLPLNKIVLAHCQTLFDAGEIDAALAALAKELRYSRFLIEHADSLLTNMLAVVMLEQGLKVYARFLDLPKALRSPVRLERELGPLTADEVDFTEVIEYEMRSTYHLLQNMADERFPYGGNRFITNVPAPFRRFLWKEALATNMAVRWYDKLIRFTSLSPVEFAKIDSNAIVPKFSFAETLRCPLAVLILYLGVYDIGDYYWNLHDVEILRRLVLIKRAIRTRELPLDEAHRFLASQPETLKHPYDGKPFNWDPEYQTLSGLGKRKSRGRTKKFEIKVVLSPH